MVPDLLKNSPCVFEGVRFKVRQVHLPGRHGQMIRRDVCEPADAVVILPMFDAATVVLIRNERFAVGQTLWELPAGTVEPGESPESCARRELIEETGYKAAEVRHLIDFFPSPGICTENMHAYLALDLVPVGQDLDENEKITVEVITLEQTMRMVRDNTIRDGKTIATLLYYHQFLGRAD